MVMNRYPSYPRSSSARGCCSVVSIQSGRLYLALHGGVSLPISRGGLSGGRVVPEWYKRAACKGETESFFSYDEEREAHALAICEDCPVRQECLEAALADRNLDGVWGGTTQGERRRFHRRGVAYKLSELGAPTIPKASGLSHGSAGVTQ